MEELCVRLQSLAFQRALLLVHKKRAVIETLTHELLTNSNETVTSERLYELIDNTPDAVITQDILNSLPFAENIPEEVCVLLSRVCCCNFQSVDGIPKPNTVLVGCFDPKNAVHVAGN